MDCRGKHLEEAREALGGQAWLNISDYQEEGRAYGFYQGQARGVGTLYFRFWKWPDKERVELTKQRDIIEIAALLADQLRQLLVRKGAGPAEVAPMGR